MEGVGSGSGDADIDDGVGLQQDAEEDLSAWNRL